MQPIMSTAEHVLPLHRCTVVGSDAVVSASLSVFCPNARHSVDAAKCEGCEHLLSLRTEGDRDVVRCSSATALPSLDPRADQRERAARVLVHEVARADVLCVRGDASVEEATALLVDKDLRCLPVVDDDRRLVGIVTRSDLLRERFIEGDTAVKAPPALGPGFHVQEIASRLVREVMTPQVHALPEQAPLSFAVALMAAEGVHEVPVVAEDGSLVGVVTALEALRWLAGELGYRLPPQSVRSPPR
jgi:CBS domain-containing protein